MGQFEFTKGKYMRLARKIFVKLALPALILLSAAARPAAAQDYTVAKVTDAAPAGVSPAVSAVLGGDVLKVTGPSGTLCELWLRKSVPAAATPDTELGVTFGQIPTGALIGVIQFPADVVDFRQQKIKAGVYTLRYALIPTDGNHMGQAPQRDFLLASPASADADPATLTFEQTVAMSAKTTGTKHPSVWSLGPPDNAALPAMLHDSDANAWDLEFGLPVGAAAPTPVALVVVGHSTGS
jgi:hypothetical protein